MKYRMKITLQWISAMQLEAMLEDSLYGMSDGWAIFQAMLPHDDIAAKSPVWSVDSNLPPHILNDLFGAIATWHYMATFGENASYPSMPLIVELLRDEDPNDGQMILRAQYGDLSCSIEASIKDKISIKGDPEFAAKIFMLVELAAATHTNTTFFGINEEAALKN